MLGELSGLRHLPLKKAIVGSNPTPRHHFKERMSIKEHIKNMSSYERAKLVVDFMRFLATAAAPFLIVGLGYFTKYVLQW